MVREYRAQHFVRSGICEGGEPSVLVLPLRNEEFLEISEVAHTPALALPPPVRTEQFL